MNRYALIALVALGASCTAQADIYKHVDEHGRVTYSNVPIKGAKKITIEPLSTITLPKPKEAAAEPSAEQAAAQARRKVLEEALDRERALLVQAKEALEQARQSPESIPDFQTAGAGGPGGPLPAGGARPLGGTVPLPGQRPAEGRMPVEGEAPYGGTASTERSAEKFDDKIKRLEEEIRLHEKNIEILKQELASLP